MKSSLEDQMFFMLNGGATKRFHTQPTIQQHTVGQHSYGVACFVWLITGGCCTNWLVMAALTHDMAEQSVGDLPSPVKRVLSPECRAEFNKGEDDILAHFGMNFGDKLSEEELRILKLADMFDGMWNCIRERSMGNKCIAVPYGNFMEYAMEVMKTTETESKLFVRLNRLWSAVND